MNVKFKKQLCKVFIVVLILGMSFSISAGSKISFMFGNHIDTHQWTKLKVDKSGNPLRLKGDFYIMYTGEIDPLSGLPIARHPRGAAQNEECGVDLDCEIGWKIKALPGMAKFLYHSGVNGNDHPVWLVNRVQIPQPGSYSHFHWITSSSNDPRIDELPVECEAQHAKDLEGIAEDITCPGWFMQISAQQSFAFKHGNEIVPIYPGKDNASHLNLITNYAEVPDIKGTR